MSSSKEIKMSKHLGSNKFIVGLVSLAFVLSTLITNTIINSFDSILDFLSGKQNVDVFKNIFTFRIVQFPLIYIVVYIICLIVTVKMTINLKLSYKSINEGQKGTSKFTTIEEMKRQYKAIPELENEQERANGGYEGKGGMIVGRYKDKIFIDDSPVNNLIIGITRSGKGEMLIFPNDDINSRAKEKPSMIFNDPKGELIAASKDTLEKRGYRIEMLNLLQPMNSMSYNPLQLIIDAYEQERYSEAQSLCKTLTYTLYFKPGTKDPFWQNSAMSLVNALILAVIDKCFTECKVLEDEIRKRENFIKTLDDEDLLIQKNKERIDEIHNEIKKIKSKMTLYTVANMLSELGSKEDEFGVNELDKYFSNLPSNSVAKMQYATSNFAKGTARGGIFSTAMSELQIFTFDEIAKMTSKNSIDLRDIGFKNGKDNKPIALFMVTPDYDKSNHVIASIFVRQLYYILAKEASLSKNGKCERLVRFELDEFGNMPPIEGMDTIMTVCLGRNIQFDLVIQAYSQLEEKYGKSYKTIVGNCGNQIYILTNEIETAEKFAKLIGEKTIVTRSRSGEFFDTTKHQTESVDSRKLLDANELMNLTEGEMVVVRVMKRTDLKHNKITPNPIFCTGKTRMKYRYEYLSDFFDNSKSLLDVNVNTLHEKVDLKQLLINFIPKNDEDSEDKNIEEDNSIECKENKEDELILKDTSNKNYVLSQIFTFDEIDEINQIKQMYLSGKSDLIIDLNTPYDIFKEFVSQKDDSRLLELLEQGNEHIKNMEDDI